MDKKKIIYIGLILILTVIVSITYFSYAFFTSKYEQRGKLNIVTGTLDYKIKSPDLTNNSIVLDAKAAKQLEIEITSLNEINSKYELYYETSNNDIEIGYGSNNDTPTGVINSNGKRLVKVVIKNRTSSSATITFGVEGGFINNTLVLKAGNHITDIIDSICSYDVGYVWKFNYTGNYQEFDVPCDGNYKMELWGAQGGSISYIGGYGGYSAGNLSMIQGTNLYLYVGGGGTHSDIGGYNGGGNLLSGQSAFGGSGGGATDVRLVNGSWNDFNSLKSRIMIAGAGGGANHRGEGYGDGNGGAGGGLIGSSGAAINHTNGYGYGTNTGGSQVSGGQVNWVAGTHSAGTAFNGAVGLFGTTPTPNSSTAWVQSGAGSGYYSGGAGNHCGAAGGSSFISGHAGCNAITASSTSSNIVHSGQANHYSGYVFKNTNMIDGNGHTWTNVDVGAKSDNLMPNPNGGYYASGIGHTGNGYARITYLGD